MNVPIRTITCHVEDEGMYSLTAGVGSGIVHDSQPEMEYDECLLKGRFIREAGDGFYLIETLLVETGQVRLEKRHIARLTRSAAAFKIPLDTDTAIRLVHTMAASGEILGRARLRLTLDRRGRLNAAITPLESREFKNLIVICPWRSETGDPLLAHKTNLRAFFSSAQRKFVSGAVLDVIFANSNGEATQGAITNLWLRCHDKLITPPLASGCLPGVMRQYLLDTRTDCIEDCIPLASLTAESEIWLSNALIGLKRVFLISPGQQVTQEAEARLAPDEP